jgi:hypothetical protein
MKSYIHKLGLLLFVLYLFITAFAIKSQAQYKPNEFRLYAKKTVAVTLTTNLLYMAYCGEKKQIPLTIQKWMNPTVATVVIGFTFYKAFEYTQVKKRKGVRW